MNAKSFLIVAGISAASFSAGLYFGPKKVETREVEKVVYREIETKKQKRDVSTHTKETQLPDGTKIRETVRDDKRETVIDRTIAAANEHTVETKSESRPGWRVGAIYKPSLSFQGESYGMILERRLFSELYVGVVANTDQTLGVTISIGF